MAKIDRPLLLVVEHDVTRRALFISKLMAEGFYFAEAYNAAHCLARFQLLRPDAVLIGALSAVPNGYHACAELRRLPAAKNIPIVVVVPAGDQPSAVKAREAGATAVVSEPIDFPSLAGRFRDLLSRGGHSAQASVTEDRSTTAQQVARLGYWELDVAEKRFDCSRECASILGLAAGQTIRTIDEFIGCVPFLERGSVKDWLYSIVNSGEPDYLSHHVEVQDGTEKFVLQHAEPVTDGSGTTVRLRGTIQDVTKMRSGETSIFRLAYYDALTDLPNRKSFEEKLRQELVAYQRRQEKFALLFIDLDNFKSVNDNFGHRVGDQVLKTVAKRLSHVIRETDVIGRNTEEEQRRVARLGGDEFTLLLSKIDQPEDAAEVAQRLIESISRPLRVDEHEFEITTSVGIAICPDHGSDSETLVQNADMAMYEAKLRGKNGFYVFDENVQSFGDVPPAGAARPDRRAMRNQPKTGGTVATQERPQVDPEELPRLRAEVKRLQTEREILMRAAALMAKEFFEQTIVLERKPDS
jgi:diguanylate cyclase (GGDEF)-like protein